MASILIDLGNSALKWSLLDDPENPFTYVHESSGILDEKIKDKWQELGVKNAYGCTVASDWIAHSTKNFLSSIGAQCTWFTAKKEFTGDFILKSNYDHPELLGADRWFAAIGSVALHKDEPLLVCHLGTASTIDSVIPTGIGEYVFLGGRIAPGPAMMREGLARGTSHLPRAFGRRTDFPTNTIDAITTGIVDSQLGLIERAVRELEGIGATPKILLAGGASKVVAPYIQQEFDNVDIRHNLVLHGLATMVREQNH